jgi:membrane protease YdiL (CAAX protease family)
LTFRGFLLSALAKTRLGFWPAATISAALWTALHAGYSYAGLASVFAGGMALSWLMWRTGSLRAVVVAHAVANVAAVLFAHFYPAL